MPGPAASNPFEDQPPGAPRPDAPAVPGPPVVALGYQRLVRDLVPGATPPSFSFAHLTRRPDQVGLTRDRLRDLGVTAPPLGALAAPGFAPPVTDPVADDPLVPVRGERIRVLDAYRSEGWPHTVAGAHLRVSV